jgi:poly-gamma-glutamate system protein
MSDLFRPRTGCWRPAPRTLALAGWILALVTLATGAAGLMPAMSVTSADGVTHPPKALAARATAAAATMLRAESFLRAERERLGVLPDAEALPDPSGLLGAEVTPLMTTLGSLEAKRIATNPAWASELTLRLAAVGIGKGDVVTASFSGSFPGLNLAVAAACEALGARLLAISSVTASTWGANQSGFTWPEMEARLVAAGLIRPASIAVTAGGDADQALDLEIEARALACRIRDAAAARLGVPVLTPSSFRDAVRLRLAAYRRAASGRPVALYVNVGGADASLGRSTAILRLRSGFLPAAPFGRPEEQGVTARVAGEGVRILVLLNIRDLALRWGIPLTGAPAGRR